MNIFIRTKREINNFSQWFRLVFYMAAAVYVSLWFFTIYLSHVQEAKKIEPLLPALPKDSIEYVRLSDSLVSGGGLSMDGKLETLRGPGYPLFAGVIKIVGNSYFAVTFVQILLVLLSSVIIRRIGMLFSKRKVGEIAATLFLLNPVTATLSLLILTDTLFLFLFVFGFYLTLLLDKDGWLKKTLVVSLFFAGAVYVRGMGLFALPVFVVPFLASKLDFKTQLKSIIVMILFIGVSVTPWVTRNYIQTGVVAWNSFESVNMSWILPKFLASVNHTDEAKEILLFQKATGVPDSAWNDLSWHDIRYSKQIASVGEKIILDRPFSYLKFHLITSIPFLFPSTILFARDSYDSALNVNRPFKYGAINDLTRGDFMSFYKDITEDWWKVLERLCWLLALFLALFAIYKNRQSRLAWLFTFIIGYLMVLSGPAAGPRLSFQAWPFLFVLVAYGAVISKSYLEEKFSWSNS